MRLAPPFPHSYQTSLEAVEIRLRDLNRRHDLLFNLFGQLGDRQEAELVSRHTYALRIIGSLNH